MVKKASKAEGGAAGVEDVEREERGKRSRDIDPVLQTLVGLAECGQVTAVQVTLCVGGALVSGVLTSAKQYFDLGAVLLEKSLSAAEPDGEIDEAVVETVRETVRTCAALYRRCSDNEDVNVDTSHIHLLDARVFMGANMSPANEGVLWRGKLTAVDGFWLGQLSQQSV